MLQAQIEDRSGLLVRKARPCPPLQCRGAEQSKESKN